MILVIWCKALLLLSTRRISAKDWYIVWWATYERMWLDSMLWIVDPFWCTTCAAHIGARMKRIKFKTPGEWKAQICEEKQTLGNALVGILLIVCLHLAMCMFLTFRNLSWGPDFRKMKPTCSPYRLSKFSWGQRSIWHFTLCLMAICWDKDQFLIYCAMYFRPWNNMYTHAPSLGTTISSDFQKSKYIINE